ncbi:hypothetical protein ACQ4PT_020974 [Festuca glaucescens]
MEPMKEIQKNKGTSREQSTNIREIEVLLLDGEKIRISLWGDILANRLNEDLLHKQTIVIVTSNLVRKFNGLSLRTTNASKVYLDIVIPESEQIMERHCERDVFPTMLEVDESNKGTIEEQMFYNRKSLKEIIELRSGDIKRKEFLCTTKATIDEIIADKGWWYMSCKLCYSAARKEKNNYICNSCNEVAEKADLRYLLKLKVSDEMTTTTFVMFNEVAQRLLGSISASTLLEQVGFSNTIPDVIQDLCGTTLIFRLKLNSRNLEECMENYKVSYTFEPKDNLEMEYLNERLEEGILESQETEDSSNYVTQSPHNEGKHSCSNAKKAKRNDMCEKEISTSSKKKVELEEGEITATNYDLSSEDMNNEVHDKENYEITGTGVDFTNENMNKEEEDEKSGTNSYGSNEDINDEEDTMKRKGVTESKDFEKPAKMVKINQIGSSTRETTRSARLVRRIKLKDKKNRGHSEISGDVPHPHTYTTKTVYE